MTQGWAHCSKCDSTQQITTIDDTTFTDVKCLHCKRTFTPGTPPTTGSGTGR